MRTHQTVHQPLVHETRTHTVQEVSQAYATPVHQTVNRPVSVARDHVVQGVAYAQAAPVAYAGHAGLGYAAAGVGHAVAGAGYGYAGQVY